MGRIARLPSGPTHSTMKNIPTLVLALSFALVAQAQLAPQTGAPLFRHMQEVNAEWKLMLPTLAAAEAPVHFNTEAERIAKHLHLVAAHLRSTSPEGLSAEAASKRASLLNDLDDYADRGVFPQNHVLPYRNPIFIDPHGTACAVGQLMIESGYRDLAESISAEMDRAYVRDMQRADVLEWATQHGFTEDELAWIQPGYAPTVPWSALGGGTNGPVQVMLPLPNGHVLIAGAFSEAGGVAVQNVAIFNGSAFIALGEGVEGTITCGAVHGTDIYLGGYTLNGINDLAHWDGSQWMYSTVFNGKMPRIHALHVLNDTLYAAGETQGFAGVDEYVMRRSGPLWYAIPGNFNAPIHCLGAHQGKLVAGGAFTAVNNDGSIVPVQHIATLEQGAWAQLGDGLDGGVLSLLDKGGTLYAGGVMYGGGQQGGTLPKFGLARIAPASSSWELLMPDLSGYIPTGAPSPEVRALLSDGDHVYIGGNFALNQMTTLGKHLARFLGTANGFEALAYFNAPVNALASNPFVFDVHGLYAGGEFTENAEDPTPYLAEALLPTVIHTAPGPADLQLFPNPATDRLSVVLATAITGPGVLTIVDAQGRTVLTRPLTARHTLLDVSELATGAYTVRGDVGKGSFSRPFLKY